jgi:transcriptional regulator with XRE-family HTH domain
MQGIASNQPAEIVARARSATRETQRAFAKRIGCTQPMICKYESGQVPPPSSLLIHCMNLLGSAPERVSHQDLIDLVRARLAGDHMAAARQAMAQVIHCLPSHSEDPDA